MSKLSACTVPGRLAGVPPNGVPVYPEEPPAPPAPPVPPLPPEPPLPPVPPPPLVNVKLFRFIPALTKNTRRTWLPAVRLMPVLTTFVHACQSPVAGALSDPVTSVPSTSRRKTPPPVCDATRNDAVYVPAVVTFTVYFSHSPMSIQPTFTPPPTSVVGSRSTPGA